jgi:uncharacterized protein involved in outer membrane biogenesis/outer membrane protein OmpA-like peptidoglycan-associated protein
MPVESFLSRPRVRKTIVAVVAAVLLYGLFGALVAPHLVKSLAQKHGSAYLGRQVTLQDVSINPYTLQLTVSGLRVLEANGKDEAVTLASLTVDAEWISLIEMAPVVRALQIEQPWVRIVRFDEEGRYNYSDVLQKILAEPKSEGNASFSINNIVLHGGRIDIDDQPFARKHSISDIEIGLPFVSNLPTDIELYVEPSVSARINDAPFAVRGRVRPFIDEREATLKIEFNALNLARYDEYSPVPLGFRISSGSLDTDIELRFRQPLKGEPLIALHGTLELRDLELDSRDGKSLIKLPALDMVLNEIEPLAGKVDIASIRIDQPDFEVARTRDGKFNLAALLPRPRAAAPSETAVAPVATTPDPQAPVKPDAASVADVPGPDAQVPEVPARAVDAAVPAQASRPDVKVALLEVLQARLAFNDEMPAKPVAYVIEPMDIVLRDFSLNGDAPANLVVSATADDGARLALDARVLASTPGIDGELTVSGVDLPRFAAYFADRVSFSVEQAQARVGSRFRVTLADGVPQGEIEIGEAGLSQLRLVRNGEKVAFAQADDVVLTGAKVNLAAHAVSIDAFNLVKPRLRMVRERDGTLDLAALVRPAPPGPPAVSQDVAAAPAWKALLATFKLTDGTLRVEDRTLAKPAVIDIDRVSLAVGNVGTDPALKSRVDLAFRDPKGGLFGARGGFSLAPMQANLKLDARRLDLLVGQPWMAEQLNATLLNGTVSLRGDLGVRVQQAGDWSLAWNGETTVEDIKLSEPGKATDLLKWRSLFVGGVALKLDSATPGVLSALTIDQLALSDYFARIIVSPQGRLNLQDIMRSADAPAQAAATPSAIAAAPAVTAPANVPAKVAPANAGPRPPIEIKAIVLQGGQVDFSDFFVKPNYRAQLSELGGRVSGVRSSGGAPGEVELRGLVEGSAPIDITGRIDPLAEKLFLDIKASARGIELAPLSPYSGKYVGYGIEKGKLSVNVAYKIENDKLTAQNNVVLDQLTFGDRVDSPDAIKAPVQLAVSLLKDRNGVIDINLPISGSLSDPQFSIGGLVGRVIVNFIVKAVTAPFALLGSLFGSQADLDHVAFAPGRAALSDTARGKLDTLGKALTDRPALKLEVTGRTDRSVDVEGYRRALLERKVRELKAGRTKTPLEEVKVEPGEYADLLERVYKDTDFPKPRNVIGMLKDLPVPEMEKLIFTNTEVSDEDLRMLGLARAQAVKDYLVRNGKIDDSRLFVLAPKTGADGGKKAADAATGAATGAVATDPLASGAKAAGSGSPPARADFSMR